ncbi:MAG: hypothetical protein ACRC4M_00085 [Mycoplasma sp.]
MDYKKYKDHIDNKFDNGEKVEYLNKLPNKKKLQELEDNIVYFVGFACIAVDIVDSSSMTEIYGFEQSSKIISEFAWGISNIMKEFGGKWITIQGDGIYCVFDSETPEEINNIFGCSLYLNTYKEMLNKKINDDLGFKKINYGIGIWYSEDNIISKVGSSKNRGIVFIGDSVNYANLLSKKASRKSQNERISRGLKSARFYGVSSIMNNFEDDINDGILMNELFYNSLNNETKYNDVFNFKNYQISNMKVVGTSAQISTMLNFVKNNM